MLAPVDISLPAKQGDGVQLRAVGQPRTVGLVIAVSWMPIHSHGKITCENSEASDSRESSDIVTTPGHTLSPLLTYSVRV